MLSSRLFPCVFVLAACGSTSAVVSKPAAKGVQAADVSAAVFEVVVPKYEPAGLEYAEPLPFHLLPKHVREDKYLSIGTAFTMDGRTFVSAAHVFALEDETQFGARRLRATDGRVYEIDEFVRHSGTRDLAVFTLREPPVTSKPLERGAAPTVGATVYTVGNAQGEGLSIRGGNVASFTPEPLESAWSFIRYSAPTSPGNSGGPLLDEQGNVIGVIVRKNSNENLNYAVPIEELDHLSASKGDFYGRFAEFESGERLVEDWRFDVALPADYETLVARGKQGFYDAATAQRARFDAKFKDTLFPTSPALRTFLREQGRSYYPAEVVRDAAGKWSLAEPSSSRGVELDGGQYLYVGKTGDYVYIALERPDDVPLVTFLSQPERVFETMLKQAPFRRTVAGVDVRVTAFGAPYRKETWHDALGRPWITAIWRLWDDRSTALHCTTYPRGLACIVTDGPTRHEPLMPFYARINALRWTLSYDGRVSDWIEYMALDPKLRPTFLSGQVSSSGHDVNVQLGAYRLAVSDAAITPESLLYADIEYASMTPPSLRVSGVAVVTKLKDGSGFRAERLVEPLSSGARDWWEDVVGGQSPYDGKVVREDDSAEVTYVQPTKPMAIAPDTVDARLVITCWAGEPDKTTDKALAKTCDTFRKTVAVTE
jgi:S1-C subfamily serine protease